MFERQVILYMYFTLKFLHSKNKITSLNNLYKSVFDLLKNVVPWTGLIYNKIYENTTTSVLFTALQVFYGTCNWLDKSLSMHVWSCLLISSWVISKKGSNFSYNFYTVFWVNSFTTIPKYSSNFSFSCQTDFVHTQCLLCLQWH